MNKILSIIILQFICCKAIAEEKYICVIKGVSSVADTGNLVEKYQEPYIEKEFTVSKETGLMKGTLQNNLGGKPIVIQSPSKDWNYKVITKSETNHSDIYYLNIEDFKYNQNMPFIFIQSGFIFHGLCH